MTSKELCLVFPVTKLQMKKTACTPYFMHHMKTFLQLQLKKLEQQRGTNIYCLEDEEENVS